VMNNNLCERQIANCFQECSICPITLVKRDACCLSALHVQFNPVLQGHETPRRLVGRQTIERNLTQPCSKSDFQWYSAGTSRSKPARCRRSSNAAWHAICADCFVSVIPSINVRPSSVRIDQNHALGKAASTLRLTRLLTTGSAQMYRIGARKGN